MKHYDCKFYLATDVFKGMCKRDKTSINADDNSCQNFEKAQKCRHCLNFSYTSEDLGTCMGRYDAYPEMNAVTCKEFTT